MREKDPNIMIDQTFNPEKKLSRFERYFLKIKRRILARHLLAARVTFFSVILLLLIGIAWYGVNLINNSSIGRYGHLARLFVSPPNGQIRELDNRTNILLLGKAGEGYTAPDLTDTIMVASINKKDKKVTLISLPRDIWIPSLRAKLNSAYYWGNKKQEGGGIILAKSTVEEIVGIPIHYAVVVDFNGFVDLINAMDGIEVNISKTFEDKRYPIAGKENDECGGDPEFNCRYETLVFYQGVEQMNGERALKYVRSRHSEDIEEGTDLARSQRQQNVIQAVKQKLMTKDILFSPKKLADIYKAGLSMIETDIDEDTMAILARFGYESKDSIASFVLPEDFIINPPITAKYDRQYVFIPKSESWREVHVWVKEKI